MCRGTLIAEGFHHHTVSVASFVRKASLAVQNLELSIGSEPMSQSQVQFSLRSENDVYIVIRIGRLENQKPLFMNALTKESSYTNYGSHSLLHL